MLAVVEDSPGTPDLEILESARTSGRILLTEDRDFGQMVFAGQPASGGGVVFVRCPEQARARLPRSIVSMVERLGARLEGHFVVWTPGRVRSRRPEGP